jgi:hypothetical protein
MAQQLSGHLWNAALLALALLVALAANRLTAAPQIAAGRSAPGAAWGDISGFVAPLPFDSMVPPFRMPVRLDPFDGVGEAAVASLASGHAVRSSSEPDGGRLTAILVADERRVAVIDDAAVGVGDVLPDGARVTAIQPNRVFVVDTKGRWQTLTLTNRGQ